MISSDYEAIEKQLWLANMVIVAPIANVVYYLLLGWIAGPKYSVGAFIFWILSLIIASMIGKQVKLYKIKETMIN